MKLAYVIWAHGSLSDAAFNIGPFNSSPLDKMAAISANGIFKCIFMNEKFHILIRISLKFLPKGPINTNIPALVQIMNWCQSGDKPLSEPMLTQFTDAYTWH